jgi:hypothetical protein
MKTLSFFLLIGSFLIAGSSCNKETIPNIRCCKKIGAADCSEIGVGYDSTTPPYYSINCICENGNWRLIAHAVGLDSSMTWEEFAEITLERDSTDTYQCDF